MLYPLMVKVRIGEGVILDLSLGAIVLSRGAGSSHHPPSWPTFSRAGPPALVELALGGASNRERSLVGCVLPPRELYY